ncbi:ATP-binding cassette domain-containing protein [Nitrososphaera sp.]|uniref:phosphonate ABC transporter ATP-binding protein n=1 Tax=Nitrososphaera sp. TaxID=1971748 RepID=UPI00307EC502
MTDTMTKATAAEEGQEYALELHDLAFSYDDRVLFSGVNLSVRRGDCVAIIGKSGLGKSTLLRIINGFLRPSAGTVRIFGTPVNGSYGSELRRKVAYIPQNLGLVENATVLENVLLARATESPLRTLFGLWDKKFVSEARALLHDVGLGDKASRKVARLSGGERQRVAIVRAVMQGARIILADEPVANLDHDTASSILDLLTSLAKKDQERVTILVVIHDQELAAKYIGEAYALSQGSFTKVAL